MAIISAYVMPHPPLAVPEVGGGKEDAIIETVRAMDEIGAEIARLKPETIIFITPHGSVFGDYFHVSPGNEAEGDFARFGASHTKLKAGYDIEAVAEITHLAKERGFPAGTQGLSDPALDHGVTVPMYYINRWYPDYKAVRVSQSGLDAKAHFEMGKILARAVDRLGRHTVVIASGDLSHKLAEDGPYGFTPEGEIFDREIMKYLSEGNFKAILTMDGGLRANAAECGYGSFEIGRASCRERV